MRVLKESFNAGEFTPRLHSRYELSKYKNGCKTLTNFVPLPQGPVTRRPGTEYIAAVADSDSFARLIPFEFSEEDSYMLEFGPLTIRYYKNGAQLQTPDSPTVLLLHGDGENLSTTVTDDSPTPHTLTCVGNANIKTSQKKFGSASISIPASGSYVSIPDHADFNIGAGTFTIDFWIKKIGTTAYVFNQQLVTTPTLDDYVTIAVGATTTLFKIQSGGSTLLSATFAHTALDSDTWYHIAIIRGWDEDSDAVAMTLNGVSQAISGTPTVFEADATGVTWPDYTGVVTIGAVYLPTEETWLAGECFIDELRVSKASARWTANFTPPSYQYPFGDDSGVVYETTTTYTEAMLPDLQYVQSADVMYIVHKDVVVRKLTRSGHVNWTIGDVSFTNAPTAWSAGDYPRTIEFYEDRLVFGGSPDQPDTIWTTDSSDYTHFNAQASISAITIALVDSGPDTITDSGNGLVTAGFVAGMPITISGYTASEGTYTIATVLAGTITLIAADVLPAETAGKKITLTGGAAADDDAITLTLLARKVNDIQWLSSGRRLLVGTGGEEWWAAGPSDTEPITPSDHVARKDSAWGSERIMPVNIGDVVFYVQRGGKTVRELIYDYQKDKYISSDLNVLSEHLTKDYKVTAMAYQQNPYQVLWCVRSDGTVLALTYLKEHDVFGWSKHTFGGDGVVESVAVIPGNPEDEVWFVIKRTVDSSVVRYVERLTDFNFGTDIDDAFFVDCGLSYNGTAATAISGLSHLEGEAVVALADGSVVTGLTVASGAIALTTAASKVHIGLANTPEFETLDVVAQDNDGTLQGILKRITNVSIRLINSMGGLFGPGSSVTDSIDYRDETALFTGWIKDLSFDEQDDVTSTVYITCDEPLPLEIAAINIDLEDE